MKVTLAQIQNASQVLSKVANHPMDMRTSWMLNRGILSLQKELKLIESTRTQAIKKYGEEQDGTKGVYTVKKENTETFIKEMDEFLSTEVDVDFQLIDASKFEGVKLSAMDISRIEKFIDMSSFESTPAPVGDVKKCKEQVPSA